MVASTKLDKVLARPLDKALWDKLKQKYQQEYLRKRLYAMKLLHDGRDRVGVSHELGISYQTLSAWMDIYVQEGLESLVAPRVNPKPWRLTEDQQVELKAMILEQTPLDHGIDRYLWTGEIICQAIAERWGVSYKTSRIYEILDALGLSHQRVHRDYANADPRAQKAYVQELKKNWRRRTTRTP